MTGKIKIKGNHKPILMFLAGPFIKLGTARQELSFVDTEEGFVVKAKKVSENSDNNQP